jgi:hypothetical protein
MSAPAGTFELIARHLTLALQSLLDGLSDVNRFKQLMFRLGWRVTSLPPEYSALFAATDTAISKFEALSDNPTPSEIAELLQAVKNAYDAIQGITTAPPGVDAGAFLAEIGERLFELLLTDYLAAELPGLYHFFQITNVIQLERSPAVPGRPSFVRVRFEWSQIGKIVSNPEDLPAIVYGWGTSDLKVQTIVDHLNQLFFALGLPVQAQGADSSLAAAYGGGTDDLISKAAQSLLLPFYFGTVAGQQIQAGFQIRELPASAAGLPGLVLEPLIPPQFPLSFPLNDVLNLRVLAGTNAGSLFGILIRPDGVSIRYPLSPGTPPPQAGIGVGIDFTPATAAILAGDATSTRLELQGASVNLTANLEDGAFVLGITAQLTGLTLVLNVGDGDSFVQGIAGNSEKRIALSLGVDWSTKYGLSFKGSSGFEVDLQPHLTLGPVSIDDVSVRLSVPSPAPPDVELDLGASLTASLGPIQFVVQGIGLKTALTFSSGNAGPFGVGLGFLPPKGVGLSVNAEQVTGGGFLYFDSDRGQYGGALQLQLADFLSISAIGLISTKMPDGSRGYSMLIILTASFSPGLELGFGFTLLAIGGLLGLNRTVSIQPVLDGVRTGAIVPLMFPQNVVANAPRIISDLQTFFPAQEGVFLIGPMAKIGCGTPTLISLSLAVIIEIPPGDAIILGVLRAALPADSAAVLVLQVNFAGVLEFDKQRFYFFATLFDSHILTITLSGQMGVLFSYGDAKNFVLSVGGFHPQFTPPPLPFPSPQRIALDLINESYARIHAEGYFAVTTNTVQFGTKSDYFFGLSSCSVSGSASFDALIQFSPFHFIAEISTQFSVKVFGVGVYGVGIDVTLTGPGPYHVHGTASLSFFFFSIDIGIDFTWGDVLDTILAAIDVLPVLAAEAQNISNWKTALPPNLTQLVVVRALGASQTGLVLHPSGTLQISQRAVPLDLKLDKFGNQPIGDANQFSFAISGTVLAKAGDLQEPFAPSQFRNFDDATKLSQPAYVPQQSGIELAAAAALASATAITRPVRYDLTIVDAASQSTRTKFFPHGKAMFSSFLAGNSAGRSKLSATFRGLAVPADGAVAVASETFTVALQSTNQAWSAEASSFSSQAVAQDFIDRAVASNPALAGTLHVIPKFEAAA